MRILVYIILAALLTSPAMAQSKKELAAQDMALAQRLQVLEKRMLTGDPAAERLMARMDSLEGSQRTLTGEVERLRFERDKLRAEIAAFNDDIESLRASLSSLQTLADRTRVHLDAADVMAQRPQAPIYRPSAPIIYDGAPNAGSSSMAGGYNGGYNNGGLNSGVPAGQPSSIPGPPVSRDVTIPVQENFNTLSALPNSGKQKLAEGNFAGAQTDFSQYLAGMPDAPDAGEIHFWLGETYYVRNGYADAADAYIASMRKAPQGVKAPDAMVRLAGALRGLGKKDEACRTLDSFPAQYPNAPASIRSRHKTELARTGC